MKGFTKLLNIGARILGQSHPKVVTEYDEER